MFSALNAGFGNVLGEVWLENIHNLGFDGIRTDGGGPHWKPITRELGEYNKLSPIFLFGGGNIADWTHDDFLSYTVLQAKYILEKNYFTGIKTYFELGNEPDIAVWEWREHPDKFRNMFWECYQAVKSIDPSIEFITGGISNLTETSLVWLAEFMREPLPSNAIIGFHRYPPKMDTGEPHRGFDTREHEMNRLRSITGSHRIMCTETGLSMGPYKVRRGPPLCFLHKNKFISEVTQGEALEHEWNFHRRRNVEGLVWYQIQDGPNRYNPADNFGMYTCCNLQGDEKFSCDVARRIFT